jgi:hypothetical protein
MPAGPVIHPARHPVSARSRRPPRAAPFACSVQYLLFGLRVHADRPLPALRPDPSAHPADVRMWIGAHPPEAPVHYTAWYVSDREAATGRPSLAIGRSTDGAWLRLRYADGTEVTVDTAGTRVGCTWPAELTLEDAATYLLGPVCGLLLRLRGVTCLHASAVAVGGRAVLMCGPAGAGKSTTAAALAARGYPVLSDDVSALDVSAGAVHVRPGYPQLKLWPDAARAVFGLAAELPPLTPNWDKRYLELAERGNFHPQPVALAAVYVLAGREQADAPRLEPVAPAQRVLTLVANTYLGWLPDLEAQARDLALYGRVARVVPVTRAVPHADAARLPELCARIEADVARHAGGGG